MVMGVPSVQLVREYEYGYGYEYVGYCGLLWVIVGYCGLCLDIKLDLFLYTNGYPWILLCYVAAIFHIECILL